MVKVLILGHRGMLGNAVHAYFSTLPNYEIQVINSRFGTPTFIEDVKKSDAEYIVNCIGVIPQKKPDASLYTQINIDLPTFLESSGKKVIHPTTDCEFSGTIPSDKKYSRDAIRDANDEYGISKATISEMIEKNFSHTKMLRTSIIGHELNSSFSLLDCFLHSKGEVNGYTNHFWNGITTLEWAKHASYIIDSWHNTPILTQLGTDKNLSKFELLAIIKDIYCKDVQVNPFETEQSINKCLQSDKEIIPIELQLKELKAFYRK